METYVRNTWEVLKRRVARQNEPAQALTYYQLPLSGIVPKPTTREEWLVIAKQVVDGVNKAVEQGFEAMSNPSAAQVDETLVKTQKESDDVAIAGREYDDAQEALAELRSDAEEAINDIMSDLRYNLRKKDDVSQRWIMKTYGATFRYLQGES